MGVLDRLGDGQHGGEADVGALHQLAPLGAGLGAEDGGEPLLQLGPVAAVLLPGQLLALEPGEPQQLGVELGLDRADRHVLAVSRLVHVVVVGAGVEHVGAPLVVPDPHGPERVRHRHERGGPVDHGGVDDLALPRALGLDDAAGDPERQEHAAAAEVAHQVERRHRRLARRPMGSSAPASEM